jgi:hypothetical protein
MHGHDPGEAPPAHARIGPQTGLPTEFLTAPSAFRAPHAASSPTPMPTTATAPPEDGGAREPQASADGAGQRAAL